MGGLVQVLRRGHSVPTHTHVEAGTASEGKTAGIVIQLMRRNTEIAEDAIDSGGKLRSAEDVIDVGVVGLDNRKARIVWCPVDGVRVTVDTDDTNSWISVEERTAMPSPAVGAIDDPSLGCRFQPGQHLWDHHRCVIRLVVWCGLIHGQSPGALAPKWKRAE